MSQHLLGRRLGGEGVASEEDDDSRPLPNVGLGPPALPIADGVGRDAKALGRFTLEEVEIEATGPEVVADGVEILGVGGVLRTQG